MSTFQEAFGEQGYSELRKICRQGCEFCKEICNIFNERAKVEQAYAEGLSKLASKALKTNKDTIGSLKVSWENIIKEMETEAEVHRTLASSLHEDVSKQIKVQLEGQIKTRKTVESVVDKSYKSYSEKLNDTNKAKRNSHSKSKESETLHEQLEECRQGRGKPISDKDMTKLETKCKKSVESAAKSDKEYRELYEKTERCRLEWTTALERYCQTCEKLEEERLNSLREMFSLFGNILAAVVPQLQQNYESIKNEAWNIDPVQDVHLIAETRGSGRGPAEQVLYECYEVDFENSVNLERRQEVLESKIQHLTNSLEREMKARAGITTLFEAYAATPDYTNEEGQGDVATQLTHANAVIDSLEGSIFKLHCALANSRCVSEPNHRLKNYIESTRDKQGALHTVLRVPLDQVTKVELPDDQEEDDVGDEFEDTPSLSPDGGRCRALYDYVALRDDELTIAVGDIIYITAKLGGGWWQGMMNGKSGVFPETYVEEID